MQRFAFLSVALSGFVTLSLSACSPLAPPDAATLATWTEAQLCDDYGRAVRLNSPDYASAMLAELDRRGKLTAQNRRDIEAQVIRTGMPDWMGMCAWGPAVDINRSGGAYGSFDQYVLLSGSYYYTSNGRIESWQQ